MKNRYSLGLFFVLSIPLIPINRLSISSRRPLSSVAFFAREARGNEGLRPFPFFCFCPRQERDSPPEIRLSRIQRSELQIYHCSHKRDVVNTVVQMFPVRCKPDSGTISYLPFLRVQRYIIPCKAL